MTISTDDVRALLAADEADAVLVLVEGRTEVIGAGQLASEPYRGALEVITREDLAKRGIDVLRGVARFHSPHPCWCRCPTALQTE